MGNTACKPVVVAPTFNNAATLGQVLDRVLAQGLPVFVVNDGSTDSTAQILARYAQDDCVTVLTHEQNRGKGAAMQTAFAAAYAAGYTHAITIDTDGQLDPEQIPQFVQAISENPQALVLGVRNDRASDYPPRSRIGRRISNHLVRLESGIRVNDSQCGLRGYPLDFVQAVKCRADRFGYETEIITRAGWAGCPVKELPVNCRYLPPGQRVSHFRPWVDSLRAVSMHGRLIARTLVPWPHVRWPEKRPSGLPTWRALLKWMSLKDAWHQLRHEESGHTMFATGLALGVFIANLPLYGVQTMLSLYASRRLHLHPAPVIIGSQASTPPIGLGMIVLAIYVGHLLLNGSWPDWPADEWNLEMAGQLAPSLLKAWALGSVIVGIVMAAVTFLVAVLFFRVLLPRQPLPESAEAD